MKQKGKIWRAFLLFLALMLTSQCSPNASKSLLNFFFDGVPEPDTASGMVVLTSVESDSIVQAGNEDASTLTKASVHYPYQERECAACHDEQSLGSMLEPQPGLCYLCHEDFAGTYAYLHGPVAGGYCTSCHDPHSSENEKLLKIVGDDLCFHCHEKKSVGRNEIHQDLDGMLCTDCHNPHGGEDKYIFQ